MKLLSDLIPVLVLLDLSYSSLAGIWLRMMKMYETVSLWNSSSDVVGSAEGDRDKVSATARLVRDGEWALKHTRLKCWSHKGSSFYWLKRGTSVACDPFLCGNRHLASNQWDTHIFGDKASFFGLDQTKPRIELIWVYSWCCWIWSPERVSPEHKMSCPSIFLRGRVASARWLKACSSDGWLRRINECHWHRWE